MTSKGLFILFAFALTGALLAAPGARTTYQDTALFFPSAELPTNTNARLQVSAVAARSENGGRITLVNTQVWVARYDGPARQHDQPIKLAIDGAGSVVVAGESDGLGTGSDFAAVKYAANGTPLWTNRYTTVGSGGYSSDYGRGMALDHAGNVYVSGTSGNGAVGSADLVNVKYASNGLPAWTNRFTVSPSNQLWLTDLSVDTAANAYVLCRDFRGSSGAIDDWIVKYALRVI